MTQRDLQIIAMVYDYEGCGVDHLRAKFFSPQSHTPCYRRIAQLTNQGYLQGSRIPAPTGLGKAFITLGANALPVLRFLLKASSLRRSRLHASRYIAHHLALCDVHLAFDLATVSSPVFTLTAWSGEGALRQAPVRVEDPQTGRTLCAVPDAAFTLSLPDSTAATFLLELDRGTVPLDRLTAQKLRVYLLRQHNPCPVLFVVPDNRRQSAIARVALEEAQRLGANPTTIWITKLVSMTPETVFAAPWVVVGHERSVTFQELAAPVREDRPVVAAGTGGKLR
jgi:Replication-relaxation